jgi:hypothetical protein
LDAPGVTASVIEPEVSSVELGGLFLSSVVVLLQPASEKRSRQSSKVVVSFFMTVSFLFE